VADILSQQEIDDLLNALVAGEVNVDEIQETTQEKKVSVYDFRRPKKFAKDQMRTLQIIYENFARLAASYFSGILRTYCQIDVISVEPQTYHEFINSLPDPAVMGIIEFRPLKGSIVLEFSPSIVYAIIDRMLGGIGTAPEKIRDFTEIEIVLIERIIRQLIPIMNDSWANVLETDFVLEHIETNAQFAQIVSPNETIAIVTLDAHIGDVEGMINVCIPHMVIEPIIKQLTTKYWFSAKLADEVTQEHSNLLTHQLKTTELELRAILGNTYITVEDFIGLQKGDVIRLDKKVDEDAVIYVENVKKFYGAVGLKNNNLAIQITDIERVNF
jgi:flagellar motor switch protein FliM